MDTVDLFNDKVSVIENDEERQDALGDMPDWSKVDLNTFITEYYGKRRVKGGAEWFPLLNKMGEGRMYQTKPEPKADAITESLEQVAGRELTMLKMFKEGEVSQLRKFIQQGMDAGDSPGQAAADALEAIYGTARKERLKILIENKPVMQKFLMAIMSPYSMKEVYEEARSFTKVIEEGMQAEIVRTGINPSQYRKESRDNFIAHMKKKLMVDTIYGRPWAWLNSLYWNCLFHWVEQEPSTILQDCARRYAYSIKYEDSVHGVQEASPEGIW